MISTTRLTKAAHITRQIRISVEEDFGAPLTIAVVFEKHQGKKTTKCTSDAYVLRRIPSEIGGVGVEVEKAGDPEARHVLLNQPGGGHSCTCKWGSYKGHVSACRHILAALQAVREGKL